jgi:signal transduction histidine kinase/CheY-like chemotaxis protein
VAIVASLGILPKLFGLPGAFRRARQGDMVGVYFLMGWGVSFVTSAVLAQVIKGELGASFWTMHALQFGSAFDILVFMRILGLRTKDIQDAMLRAEASTRMKSEFLANMSHEIRTPMNAIIGMSRLALMAEPNPKLRNYLSKILGAGEHLLGIINDILDFSKIEAGRMALDRVPFDLDEMLDHLSSITAIKTNAKHVELVFSVPRGVPARLVGDPLRLGQVLINLTNNAVKFTEQGEIVVGVEVVKRSGDDVVLRFSVSDSGIGMTPEQLARLFQSFTQADNSVTRKYGGTGLGLSISKQLVELMGGTIDVSSTPGVGSRFSFTVPLGVAGADSASAPLTAAALQRLRVMVVDDSASTREALLEMLRGFGIDAVAVASGEESLDLLADAMEAGAPYQVVLMDYLMPGWDGVETIRRIRADRRFAAPPAILMISAYTREGVLQQEGDLPLSGFLTKPIGPALLYHSLVQVLRPELAAHGQLDGGGLGLANGNGIAAPNCAPGRRAHPAGRRQCQQPRSGARFPGRRAHADRRRHRRPAGRGHGARRRLRPGADGHPDAGPGRPERHAPDPRHAGTRRAAGGGDDRARHGRRPRTQPGSRHERPRGQADRSGPAVPRPAQVDRPAPPGRPQGAAAGRRRTGRRSRPGRCRPAAAERDRLARRAGERRRPACAPAQAHRQLPARIRRRARAGARRPGRRRLRALAGPGA